MVTQTKRKTRVRPESRIDSAISFGVFCRSRALDERDHTIDEGGAGRNGDLHRDLVGKHLRAAGNGRAVAAGFADDGSGFAGDCAFIDRSDPFDHLAVAGNEFAGGNKHDIADGKAGCRDRFDRAGGRPPPCDEFRLGPLQTVGLGAAAPFGDGLCKGRKEHGKPEPGRNLAGKARLRAAGKKIAQEKHGDDGGDSLGDEDHRIAHQLARVELDESIARGRQEDGWVEKARRVVVL